MPVPLRTDFGAAQLRAIAKRTKNAAQARRLLALGAIYEGASRTAAAQLGGVTLQIVRDWVIKFNAHRPEVLIVCKASGQPAKELCWNLGDEADQAALCGFSSMTSIPSWNLAPAMSLGN
jgi:hypothetical protein